MRRRHFIDGLGTSVLATSRAWSLPRGASDNGIPPPAPYHADAVHFDGATSLRIGSLSTPVTSLYAAVRWFRTTQDATEPTLYVTDPNDGIIPYEILRNGALGLEVGSIPTTRDAFDVRNTFDSRTTVTFNDGNWHCSIWAFDASTGAPRRYKLYVDDVAIALDAPGVTGDTGADPFTIAGNGFEAWIGTDGFDSFVGDLADYRTFYNVPFLDESGDIPLAIRRLFIDGSGKPVDPAVATAALGTAGTILFSGDASTFGVNQGSGGASILTGTLTNAPSPSD